MNISVIMPTFNRGFCLLDSVKSVLDQDYTEGEIELVVVDDCSNDNTAELICSISDSRVKYIRNASNQGAAESRNIGVRFCSYELISFIDSDVVWYSDKLSTQVEVFEKKGSQKVIVYCGYKKQDFINRDIWRTLPRKFKSGWLKNRLMYANFIDTPSLLLAKEEFLKSGGFDKKLPRFQDWDLVMALSDYCIFEPCASVLYDSYSLSESITTSDESRVKALVIIYEKHYSYIRHRLLLRIWFELKLIRALYKLHGGVSLSSLSPLPLSTRLARFFMKKK